MLFSSFYFDIPTASLVTGLVAGLALCVFVGLSRKLRVAAPFAFIGCAVIALFVIETGKGDMKVFFDVFWAPVSGIAGAVVASVFVTIFRKTESEVEPAAEDSDSRQQDGLS